MSVSLRRISWAFVIGFLGDRALQLAAKAPGENDTIQGNVKIAAIS
jgi:hypothetical protein